MELSTNPNTVQRAFTELERQEFIYAVKGKGNFVRGNEQLKVQKLAELKAELQRILKEAADIGIDPKTLLAEIQEDEKND